MFSVFGCQFGEIKLCVLEFIKISKKMKFLISEISAVVVYAENGLVCYHITVSEADAD